MYIFKVGKLLVSDFSFGPFRIYQDPKDSDVGNFYITFNYGISKCPIAGPLWYSAACSLYRALIKELLEYDKIIKNKFLHVLKNESEANILEKFYEEYWDTKFKDPENLEIWRKKKFTIDKMLNDDAWLGKFVTWLEFFKNSLSQNNQSFNDLYNAVAYGGNNLQTARIADQQSPSTDPSDTPSM